MRWLAVLTIAVVVLSGCAPQADKSNEEPSGEKAPVESSIPKGENALPVHASPAVLKKVTFPDSTAVIDRGNFSLDVKTGQVEAWEWSDPKDDEERLRFAAHFAPDGDWVWGSRGNAVYWVERRTGKTVTYDSSQVWAFAEGAGRRLLAGQGPQVGAFWVTDQSFNLVRAFDLSFKGTTEFKLGDGALAGALFAPDGKRVAIGYHRVVGGVPADPEVVIVDLTTGAKRILAGRPDLRGWNPLGATPIGNAATGDLLVSHNLQAVDPTGLTRERSVLMRYDWQGNLQEQFDLPGQLISLSPDGRLMAVQQDMGFLTTAAVIMEVATGKPLFRVTWSSPGKWLSDSSGLLLRSDDEELIVSAQGELTRAPVMPASKHPVFGGYLRPSPVDSDQFTAGLAVVDRTGKVLREIKLPDRTDLVLWGADWSTDGTELRFAISWPTGKGNLGGGGWRLPSRVEVPPFNNADFLQVKDPRGECLNLRATPESAKALRCLPSGTKLAVGDLFQAPMKLNAAVWSEGDQVWLWVRTSEGQMGFINVTRDRVTWAD